MINIEICREAKKKLNHGAWDYLVGGSEDELALRRNRMAFQQWSFVPRVLKDVSTIDATTKFLGIPMRMPVIAAPIGGLTQFHDQGDLEWARGLSMAKVTGVVSGVARVEFEKIIKQTTSPLFYQLYFYGDDKWVKDQLQSAAACGYKAIVVTVDTACYGQRERDLLSNYDARTAGWRTAPQPPDRARGATLNWKEVEKMKRYTKLPLILKGIVAPDDVLLAKKAGVDALWISNHGGRQLDQSLSALDSLIRLPVKVSKKPLPIIFDGGIRRGSNILTALLLGADVVAVGRLPVYGLIHDGAAGLKAVIDNLEEELKNTMKLIGLTNLKFSKSQAKQLLTKSNIIDLSTMWDGLEK